jgi:hypothetical protein
MQQQPTKRLKPQRYDRAGQLLIRLKELAELREGVFAFAAYVGEHPESHQEDILFYFSHDTQVDEDFQTLFPPLALN